MKLKKEYNWEVLLGKGDHPITSSWTNLHGIEIETTLEITRSNITFVGTGKDTTKILGGFGIENQRCFWWASKRSGSGDDSSSTSSSTGSDSSSGVIDGTTGLIASNSCDCC